MSDTAAWRRLHPGTIAIEVQRFIGRFAFAIIVFVGFSLFGASGGSQELIYAAFGALALIGPVARYLSFTYAIEADRLLIRSGIITRQKRAIPLDRVQNVNLRKSFLHQLIGIVDVEIQTASGAGAEALLSAVSEDEAERLRFELLRAIPGHGARPMEASGAGGRAVYHATTRDLLILGATQNRALTILIGIAALFGFVVQPLMQQADDQFFDYARDAYGRVNGSGWILWLALGLGLFIFGWIASIVMTYIRYYDFRVVREGDRFRRSYGLINKIEAVIKLRRVQLVMTTESMMQRLFGLCSAHVETAGGYGPGASGGEQQKQDAGSSMLAPLLAHSRLGSFTRWLLPDGNLTELQWQKVSPLIVLLSFRSSLLWLTVICVPAAIFFRPWMWNVYVGLLGLSVVTAYLRYRTTAWADLGGLLAARAGVLGRTTFYLPTSKVQSTRLRQSPLQRRLNLVTIEAVTAASGVSREVVLEGLGTEAGVGLTARLRRRSAEGSDPFSDAL